MHIACSGDTPSPRAAHGMALCGQCVYVFGGRDREGRVNDLFALDTVTWEWNELASVMRGVSPVPRSFVTLTAIDDKLVSPWSPAGAAVVVGSAGLRVARVNPVAP